MDLIERYLAAIGRNLPSKQAPDIKAELRDVLLSRVEDQEAERGRPLDRGEVEALLTDFGHPLTVAGRYRKVQHLIGPEVFPFWWASVKVMLAVVAGVYLVLIILAGLAHKTEAEFNHTVPSAANVVIFLFGLITLAFAGFELFRATAWLGKWKPGNLPPATGKTRSPFELGVEMTCDVAFILWWLGLIHFPNFFSYPGFLSVDLAPVWMAWKWPIIGYGLLEIAVDFVAIIQPSLIRTNVVTGIVRYLVGMGILSQIIQAGHWLVVSGPTQGEHAISMLQTNFDLGMKIGIGFTIAAMVFRIGQELWRLRHLRIAELSGYSAA
jgi:hypothetical protein